MSDPTLKPQLECVDTHCDDFGALWRADGEMHGAVVRSAESQSETDAIMALRWELLDQAEALTALASERDAAESAAEFALNRLWEIQQQAHSELACLRRELAAAEQRIFDLEVQVEMLLKLPTTSMARVRLQEALQRPIESDWC